MRSSIKVKYGICPDCPEGSKEKPLTAKRCYFHNEIFKEERKEGKRKMRENMNAFLAIAEKPKKQPKPIPKISQKQIERLAQYRKVRDQFMKDHPTCQARLESCTIKATDIHHAKGKIGDLLMDKRYFKALCRSCHSYLEVHPNFAKEQGFSLNRLE